MKSVLITGGCGFIGSNLANLLHKKGIPVVCLDNYSTGVKSNHCAGVTYVRGETKYINATSFDRGFSHIFHLGEYSRVEQSFDDIDLVFDYNHSSIYEVLKFAQRQDAKLIYAGSSTKFGDDGLNSSASPYAWTKKTNSELIKAYSDWFGLDYAIAYFYNVFGENEISEGSYATVIAKYLRMVENGCMQLPVVQPGTQVRNFTHVDDIVKGLFIVGEQGSGDNYGIGSDLGYSIVEVVSMMGCDIEWLPARRGNRLTAPVISDKTKALGWQPMEDLAEYISIRLARRENL